MGEWMAELFEGFDAVDARVGDGGVVHAQVGGTGPPVLLLHGFPQTHAMWHGIARTLAERYTVVAADLRGYGDSRAGGGTFTFRAMAEDQVRLMGTLGHGRFHVVGHDRGARVTHRMALDHPDAVASVALLDILPTLRVWDLMDAWLAQRYYHWMFLALDELPARLVNHDPVYFLHRTLGGLGGGLDVFDPRALAEYERAARRPEVVAAWCADYRAAARDDLDHDRADLGRLLDRPALVLWGEHGVVGAQRDPVEVWREHFPSATGRALPAGHFLVEQCPADVATELLAHLETAGTV